MQKIIRILDNIKRAYYRVNTFKFWFYSLMIFGIIAFWITAFFTRGDTLMKVLFINKNDSFMDFFNSIPCGRKPYENGVIYPPLANVFHGVIGHVVPISSLEKGIAFIRNSQVGFLLGYLYFMLSSIFFTILILKIKKGCDFEKYIFLFVILLSTPFLYVFERGNLCFLTLTFLMLFLHLYDSEKKFVRYISYLCLAIAVSFKIYPIIFILLLIRRKIFKEVLICGIVNIVVFVLPILFLGGFKNFLVFLTNIKKTTEFFQNNTGYGFKVNITNTVDLIVDVLKLSADFRVLGNVFVWVFALVGGILIVFADFKNPWKLVCIPTLMMILLPGFSFTYVIIFLLIPLLMFLDEEKKKTSKLDYIYLALFILIFIPVLEVKENLFGRICSYYYSYNLTTFIETVSISTMAILIYFEGTKSIIFKVKNKEV